MSIEVMRYVWKYSKSKGADRLMLLAIADIANDNGDAYPGVDKLSVKCNTSHRSAQLTIQDLERIKELQVFENVGTKTISGWTNLYRVTLQDVKQGEVRKPNGEIATARLPKAKKERLFLEGVQPVTPLEGVQPDSPDDVQPVTPHGVKPVTPNPPEDTPANNTSLPNGKGRKPDPEFDTISSIWNIKAGGWVSNIQGMIFGSKKVKGEWLKCQFEPPATLTELQRFEPYLRQRMIEKKITDVPTAAVTIQRWFYDYREVQKKATQPRSWADIPELRGITEIIT